MNNRTGANLDRVTNGVAAGGVSMPVWFPALQDVSGAAVHLVPILSALWLAVQIVTHIRRGRKG